MRSFGTFFSALAVVALAACGSGGTLTPAPNDPGGARPQRQRRRVPERHALGRLPDAGQRILDQRVMYVNVYPPGSGKLSRRIGPLPADYNGSAFPVIAVDSLNRLYVATNGQLYRFGAGAQGADAPQRVTTDSTLGRPVAMAVGPNL